MAGPNQIRRKAWAILKWEGLFALLWKGFARLLKPIVTVELECVFECDLHELKVDQPFPPELRLTLHQNRSLVEKLARDLPPTGGISSNLVRTRLLRGDLAAVVYRADRAVGFSWLCTDPAAARAMEPSLSLRPGEAYQYDTFVVPAFRGKALHSHMHVATGRDAAERGYVTGITYVDRWNRPSLKTQQRLGKRRVQLVLALISPRRDWYWSYALGSRSAPPVVQARRAAAAGV